MERIKLTPKTTDEMLAQRINTLKMLDTNRQYLVEFIDHRKKVDYATVNKTLLKQINAVQACDKFFNADFTRIREEHYLEVLRKLKENEITQESSKPYSEFTKKHYIKDFRQFLRWLYKAKTILAENGDRLRYDDIFSDFIYHANTDDIKEPVMLSKDEIMHAARTSTLRFATILLVGFDSGCRPEELANLRIADVSWDDERKVYKVYVRYVKKNSHKRTLDLPLCTEYLKSYLEERKKIDAGTLFDINASSLRTLLHRKFPQHKRVSIYSLRHSSIQYYLTIYHANFAWMAQRYGWEYSAVGARLKDYLARSKMSLPDASELIHADKITKVEEELNIQKSKYDLLKQDNQKLREVLEQQEHRLKLVEEVSKHKSKDLALKIIELIQKTGLLPSTEQPRRIKLVASRVFGESSGKIANQSV